MKCKKVIALLLAAVMLLSMTAMAAEPAVSGENAVVNGNASSVVMVNAEPVQMTVTVPAVLPATVDAKGTVLVATDAKVINHSYGPVAVTAINANAVSPWSLVGAGFNFAAAKVNAKQVQLAIEGQIAEADGTVPMTNDWVIAGGDKAYPFSYNVKIGAQSESFTENLASVIFTVDWDETEAAPQLQSLTLDLTDKFLVQGATYIIHALPDPEDAEMSVVTWESSVPGAVAIESIGSDSAMITAVSATAKDDPRRQGGGSSKITATCGGKTVSTWVQVTPVMIPETLCLDVGKSKTLLSELLLMPGVDADSLNAWISGATLSVVSGTQYVLVNGHEVIGISPGEATVRVNLGSYSKIITVVVMEPLPPPATDASLEWEYTTSGDTIALGRYIGESSDVVVHGRYAVGDKTYEKVALVENPSVTSPPQSSFMGNYADRENITSVEFDGDIEAPSNSSFLFYNLTDVKGLGNIDTNNVTNMEGMFYYCTRLNNISGLANWDTSGVTSMWYTFGYCRSLTNVSALANWDVSKVTHMDSMFYGCSSLTTLDISGWDLSSLTTATNMFSDCTNLNAIYVKDYTAYNKLYSLSNVNIPSGCSVIVGSPA